MQSPQSTIGCRSTTEDNSRGPPPGYTPISSSMQEQIPHSIQALYRTRFQQLAGGRTHITGAELAMILVEANLPRSAVAEIWERSDSDQDGRFDENEFIYAMWLVDTGLGRDVQEEPAPATFAPIHGASGLELSANGVNHITPITAPKSGEERHKPNLSFHDKSNISLNQQSAPEAHASGIKRQSEVSLMLSKALVCRNCKKGLFPRDKVSYCEACGDGFCFCMECFGEGASCPHKVPPVMLVEAENLVQKGGKDCARCWKGIKKGSLLWHCPKCTDAYRCPKCCGKGKYCKHVGQEGIEVALCSSSKDSSTGEVIEVVTECAGWIFGF